MVYLSISLIVPYLVSLYYDEDPRPWLFPILLCFLIGLMLLLRYRSPEVTRPTEAMFIVATAWLVMAIMGAIPFVMYGMGVVDALFEAMSGFTTTGSSIMSDIESWPKSILFWRSFTQWLGGAGVDHGLVTVLPMLGVGGATSSRTSSRAWTYRTSPRASKRRRASSTTYTASSRSPCWCFSS